MRWRPRFIYGFVGSEVTLLLDLPQRLWVPEEGIAIGNEDVTAAGIPIAEWLRYDQAVAMRIRFRDAEYNAVMTFVEFQLRRKHMPITMRLEWDNFTTEYTVYMEKPSRENRVKPARDPNDETVWELDFTFRTTNAQRVHVDYFADVPIELIAPTALAASNFTFTSFRANWSTVIGANDYLLDVSTDPLFGSFLIHDEAVGGVSRNVTGLAEDSGPYYYRLRSRFGAFVTGYSNVTEVELPHRLFVNDTFSGETAGTNVDVHVGERGAVWTPHPTFAAANTHKISNAGRVYGTKINVTRGSAYFASGVASSAAPVAADYKVTADLHVKSLVVNSGAGIYGRMDPVNDQGYMLWYDNITATRKWFIYKGNWGQTVIGQFAEVLVAGNTYALELRMVGNQIQAYINGVLRINVADVAPMHSAAGRAGKTFYTPVSASSDTLGFHIDNVRAESIG